MTPSRFSTWIIAAAIALPGTAAAAARAELRPSDELAVDTPAQLIITVDGQSASRPAVRVANADVEPGGQMVRTSIVNGSASVETSFVYTIVPRKIGTLDIPAIRVGGDETAPIRAVVSAAPRAPGAGSRAPSAARAKQPTRAFVRIDVPSRTLYVGEAVPAKIRAYFRAGTAVTLQGPPKVGSPAFTLAQLSGEPTQTEVMIDGVPHLQATWTGVLSPAKPTDEAVSIELPVEIAYRERVERPRRSLRDVFGRDPFGDVDSLFADPFFDEDPFAGFDSMFDMGPVRRQQLTLRHNVGRVRIADVPATGKPDAFGGAVGDFELAIDAPTGELRVGEPITLTYRVTGTGNFDRVQVDGIAPSADWKVYPGTSTFDPGTKPVTGTKTFTQTIVPNRAGELSIPAVTLAYFDPKAKSYRTDTTEPVTVTVAPPAGGGAADPGLASSSVRDAGMTANRVERGVARATLTPLIRRGSFWLLPGALVALTAAGVAAAWWRRSPWLRAVGNRRRVDRAVARERAKLDAAMRDGSAAAFFEAARNALQLRLAAEWHVPHETITAADVRARLGEDGDPIRAVLEQADRITYAHGTTAESLDQWHAIVVEQLAKRGAAR